MDYKQIVDLIKTINKSNIAEFVLEIKDVKLKIKQKEDKLQHIITSSMPAPQQESVAANNTTTQENNTTSTKQVEATATPKPEESFANSGNYVTIKSPMIGTFYRRPAPDKPLLVDVGDEVKPDSVVCIIEAMKLFNEIESEVTGRVVKVLVEDASPVEFEQPLFLVEPS